ncbi:MAG: hypothetical protein HUJ94_03550 [Bacteroidales bacterium]|nr:hypothetical protein [Bacteroidales bacterium]
MDNSQQALIQEIRDLMQRIQGEVFDLESKLFRLQQALDEESGAPASAIDLDIDLDAAAPAVEPVAAAVISPEPEPAPAVEPVAAAAISPEPEPALEVEPEPVIEPEPVSVPAPAPAPAPATGTVVKPAQVAEPDDDMPDFFMAPQPAAAPVKDINSANRPHKKAVLDVMSDVPAWKTDMPGTEVKNIMSAISLNDRILFINTLFGGAPELFTSVVSELNAIDSLDAAVNLLEEKFPQWNMDSETVYRFMMAARRKIRKA